MAAEVLAAVAAGPAALMAAAVDPVALIIKARRVLVVKAESPTPGCLVLG